MTSFVRDFPISYSLWDDFELLDADSLSQDSFIEATSGASIVNITQAPALSTNSSESEVIKSPTSEGSSVPLKRSLKRSRNVPLPRIIKSDIRRFYAAMFNNAFNSMQGDKAAMFLSFLKTYSVESVQIMRLFQNVDPLARKFEDPSKDALGVYIRGPENIARDLCNRYNVYPDLSVRLKDYKIARRPYETACIIFCEFSADVTMVYDVTKLCESSNNLADIESVNVNSDDGPRGIAGDLNTDGEVRNEENFTFRQWVGGQRFLLNGYDSFVDSGISLLPMPQKKTFSSYIALHVDESKRIERMTFYKVKELSSEGLVKRIMLCIFGKVEAFLCRL